MDFSLIGLYLPFFAGLAISSVFAGILAGLLGVGGGVILVPAMALLFGVLGYDPAVYHHVAVGTSLAVIIATGISSARAHYRRGAVMLDVVKLWGPFVALASFLGGISARYYTGDALRVIFGVIALFLAINVAFHLQKRWMSHLHNSPTTHRMAASVVGYIASLMGIGGGSLSVPTLSAFGHQMHKAVGTSAALGPLIALPGSIGFVLSGIGVDGRPPFSFGYVNIPATLLMGIIATLFAPVGVALAHRLDRKQLELAFAVFLAIVGLRMVWQALMG